MLQTVEEVYKLVPTLLVLLLIITEDLKQILPTLVCCFSTGANRSCWALLLTLYDEVQSAYCFVTLYRLYSNTLSRTCSTYITVSSCERPQSCHHTKDQSKPAQHGMTCVSLHNMGMVEDAEQQN